MAEDLQHRPSAQLTGVPAPCPGGMPPLSAWLGNSQGVAEDHCLLVTPEDILRVAGMPSSIPTPSALVFAHQEPSAENEEAVSPACANDTASGVPPREIATNFFRFFAGGQHGPTLVSARQMAQTRQRWSLGELQMPAPSQRCCAICVPTGTGRRAESQGRVFHFLML